MLDPLQMLMDEHKIALSQLDILDRSAEEIRAAGFSYPVWERLSEAARFIAGDIRAHNQREEDFLFPALEKYLPPGGPTYVMRDEHRQLWEGYDRLHEYTEKIKADPEDKRIKEELAKAAHFVMVLLSNHIYKEDNVLFPMARRILNDEQLHEIGSQFIRSKNEVKLTDVKN
jgi:hypothetical protein